MTGLKIRLMRHIKLKDESHHLSMCSVCPIWRSTFEALHNCGLKPLVSQFPIRIGLGLTHFTQETNKPQTYVCK